jgi:transcriptional regulator
MYSPPEFRVDDPDLLYPLIERFNFGTLITVVDGRPQVSHLPFLLDRPEGQPVRLLAHMARANHQWQSFTATAEALAIFQGEHGYVSPAWYETQPAVPTWNYQVVHAHGTPRIFTDETHARDVLRRLVTKHEARLAEPWPLDLPADYFKTMLHRIVAFEMPLIRLEGKFKLNQNRSRRDQELVVATLSASSDPTDRALAAAMQRALQL